MEKILILLLISLIYCGPYDNSRQTFVKSGTGLKGVSYQWQLEGMREGCLFMAICCIGGLGSDADMQLARQWAISKGYIREDTYVNMGSMDLAAKISSHFNSIYHSDFNIAKGCGHFWAIDSNGVEVFNAAGLGYTGC